MEAPPAPPTATASDAAAGNELRRRAAAPFTRIPLQHVCCPGARGTGRALEGGVRSEDG